MARAGLGVVALAGVLSCGRIDFGSTQHGDARPADGLFATPAVVTADGILIGGSATNTLTVHPIGTGHLVIAGITIDSAGSVSVIGVQDDGPGNTYVSAGARSTTANFATEIWYAANTQPGGTTVTATLSGSPGATVLWVIEVAGADPLAPLDRAATNMTQVAAMVAAPNVITTVPNELVYSILDSGGSATGIVAGNPFTALAVVNGDDSAYAIAATPGAYGAVWDMTGTGAACASTASFRAAAQ